MLCPLSPSLVRTKRRDLCEFGSSWVQPSTLSVCAEVFLVLFNPCRPTQGHSLLNRPRPTTSTFFRTSVPASRRHTKPHATWSVTIFTARSNFYIPYSPIVIDVSTGERTSPSKALTSSLFWAQQPPPPPQWAGASPFTRFLDHTQRRTTVGRTPLDEWSAHRKDLYLTKHNTHNRQTSMLLVGFEPTILTGERPQTYALDRAATLTDLT
jgi:hypothetical protein